VTDAAEQGRFAAASPAIAYHAGAKQTANLYQNLSTSQPSNHEPQMLIHDYDCGGGGG
jgi:hypothetical protein